MSNKWILLSFQMVENQIVYLKTTHYLFLLWIILVYRDLEDV